MCYRVGDGRGLGLGYKYLVAPVMVGSRTNVVGSEAMVAPGLALEGRDMGDAELAYGMKGVGKEIHGKAVHTVVGRAGGDGLPGP